MQEPKKGKKFFRILKRGIIELLDQKDTLIYPISLLAVIASLIVALNPIIKDEAIRDAPLNDDPFLFVLILIPVTLATTVFLLRYLSTSKSLEEEEFQKKRLRDLRKLQNNWTKQTKIDEKN